MGAILERPAVLCDDDPMVRSAVAQLLADAGFQLAGESDSVELGLEEVGRVDADLVVLDLALRAGSGEHLLAALREHHPTTRVVVFSAYVGQPARLLDAGATAVVEKPDFTHLEQVLEELATSSTVEKRRPPPREVPDLDPPPALSITGLEPWSSFRQALDGLVVGDAVLAFDVAPKVSVAKVWDDVFRTDFRLAMARAVVSTRRPQDRVSLAPEGLPVMAAVGGHPEAPSAVFERVEAVWCREVDSGVPLCAFGHVRAGGRADVLLARAVTELLDEGDPQRPLRML